MNVLMNCHLLIFDDEFSKLKFVITSKMQFSRFFDRLTIAGLSNLND